MLNNHNENIDYGRLVNFTVAAVGVIGILLGIVLQNQCIWGTICLSVGTSVLATALVTKINTSYLLRSQRIEKLISTWQLHNMYETKSDMNTLDANRALEQCTETIDIIGEGLSSYIGAQGHLLRNKILHGGVRVRIISCDDIQALKMRARDESRGWDDGDAPVEKVIALDQWVSALRQELGDRKDNLQIRYHSSYPGLSYLKLDTWVFVSANLWRKTSQQSFALSFTGEGKGGKYFSDYFEDVWANIAHEQCKLR